MINFKKIFGAVLILGAFCFANSKSFAADVPKENQKSVVVISDRLEQANVQYFVYPQVSEMIAAEVINELNLSGAIKAPALSTVREKLRSEELVRAANKLLSDYRYTYELNFGALKKIAKNFDTSNVLIVTGGLDTVSDFLKPTWWNFLNVPGENVVKSEYRLYTYMALVDLNTETITWQNTYHRQITAPEFALANATYSPDYRQLTKIKKGSLVIAKDAAYRVESVLTPWFAAQKEPPTVHERVKYNIKKHHEEYIQNVNERKRNAAAANTSVSVPTSTSAAAATSKSGAVSASTADSVTNAKEQPAVLSTPDKNRNKTKLNETDLPLSIKTEPLELPEDPAKSNVQVSPLNIIIPKM